MARGLRALQRALLEPASHEEQPAFKVDSSVTWAARCRYILRLTLSVYGEQQVGLTDVHCEALIPDNGEEIRLTRYPGADTVPPAEKFDSQGEYDRPKLTSKSMAD